MAIFIGAVLALLSIGVVLYPFLKPRATFLHPALSTDSTDDEPDLESIYDSIRTLQLEHQLGNVTEGLYREQLNGYRVQAAMALRRQVEGQSQDADWALEQEIKVAAASLSRLGEDAIPCTNCGTMLNPALTQCPECSIELASGTSPEPGPSET